MCPLRLYFANSAVFPRNWACFRLVPQVLGLFLGFCASFCAHATIFGLVSKVVVFMSCVTLRAIIFYVS